MWVSKSREILFDGPAGTGKSRAVCEKANLCAMKYPMSRILFLRKTRASMTESVLVTFEDKVLTPSSPIKSGPHRSHRQSYIYPNGSMIVLGGMDNADRIMSTEYDMICVFESTELTLDDWEKLLTRLRNGVMPYQQIIADCNPSGPTHWLKVRADDGGMNRIMSRHEDNPAVTQEYLGQLARLTGHRKDRLFKGTWTAAEGMIYDTWDAAKFVMSRKPEDMKRWIMSIDEGFANPCAMYLYGVDGDGRVHVFREFYRTKQKEQDVVAAAKELYGLQNVEYVVVDPSAAKLIAALTDNNISTVPADNSVYEGIIACQDYIHVGDDGRPRLTVDPECTNFVREIEGYQWATGNTGIQDKPVKVNDHAMDALRYAVMYLAQTSGSMELIVI